MPKLKTDVATEERFGFAGLGNIRRPALGTISWSRRKPVRVRRVLKTDEKLRVPIAPGSGVCWDDREKVAGHVGANERGSDGLLIHRGGDRSTSGAIRGACCAPRLGSASDAPGRNVCLFEIQYTIRFVRIGDLRSWQSWERD